MTQSNTQNGFPNLNLDELKLQTSRWVEKYSKIDFKRIVLYRYAPRNQEYYNGTVPVKYVVVFEVHSKYRYNPEAFDLSEDVSDEEKCINKFVADTEYYQTIKDEQSYLALMSNDFENVYQKPPENYKKEWIFVPKFHYEELNEGIRRNEVHVILYQSGKRSFLYFRDRKREEYVWNNEIVPILTKYDLDGFEYNFEEDSFTEVDILKITALSAQFCNGFSERVKGIEDVMRMLRRGIEEEAGKNGRLIDLRSLFTRFLDEIFQNNTLHHFLNLLDKSNEREGDSQKIAKISDNFHEITRLKECTMWEDVKITLISNEMVEIKTSHSKGRFTYHELGMKDRRKGDQPTILWATLVAFAKNHGIISAQTEGAHPMLYSSTKRLNKHLQRLFNINDTIFKHPYNKYKKYESKIFFCDRTIVLEDEIKEKNESVFDDELNNLDKKLGLPEKNYYND